MIQHDNDMNFFPSHSLFFARTYFPSQHVSGSAYRITNKRAYHHGTMLISTRLDHLGTVLRPETVPIAFPTSLTAFFGAIFWINSRMQHCCGAYLH